MATAWQDESNTITVGRCPFNDGSCYYGQWDQQRFAQGYGCWIGCQKKGKFEGYYQDGLEIIGTYTWPSGEIYHGQWSNGQRHGFGIQKYKGSIYAGYWNRGICDYLGAIWNRCGSIYFGTWQDGHKTGYATEAYLDGYYHGQFSRDQRHGYGVRVTYQEQPYTLSDSSPSSSLRSTSSNRLKKKLKLGNGSIFNGNGLFSATTSYTQRQLDIKSRPRLHDEIFDIQFNAQDNDDNITNCHNLINNNNNKNSHHCQTELMTDTRIKSTLPFNSKDTQSKCQTTTTVNIDSSTVPSHSGNQLKDIGNNSRKSSRPRSHSQKNFHCKYNQHQTSDTTTANNDTTTPYLTTSNLDQLFSVKTTNKPVKTTTSLKYTTPMDKSNHQDTTINRQLRKNHTIDIGEQFLATIRHHNHIQSNTTDIQKSDLIHNDINHEELTTFDNLHCHQANNRHTLSREERSSPPNQHQTIVEKNDQPDGVRCNEIVDHNIHQQSDHNKEIKINSITLDNPKNHQIKNYYTLSLEESSNSSSQHQTITGNGDQKDEQYYQSDDVIYGKISDQDSQQQQSESNKINISQNGKRINGVTFNNPKDLQSNNYHSLSLEERSSPPNQHQKIIGDSDQYCQSDSVTCCQILHQDVHQQSESNKMNWNTKNINGVTFNKLNDHSTLSLEERSDPPGQHQIVIEKNDDKNDQPNKMIDTIYSKISDQNIHQPNDNNNIISNDWNRKSINGITKSTPDSTDDDKCQIRKQHIQEEIKSTLMTNKVKKGEQSQDNGCHTNDDTELILKYGHDFKIHWKENGINHSSDTVPLDKKQGNNKANNRINGHMIQNSIKTDFIKVHPVSVRSTSLGRHHDSNHHHISNGADDTVETTDNHSHILSDNNSKRCVQKTQSVYSYDWDFNQRDIMEGIKSLQIYINNHQSRQQGENNPISTTTKTHHVPSTSSDHDDDQSYSHQYKNQGNNLFSSTLKGHSTSSTIIDTHNLHADVHENNINHCPSTNQELCSATKHNHNGNIYSNEEGNSTSSIIQAHNNNHDTDTRIYTKRESHSVSSTMETHQLFSSTNIDSKRKDNAISNATRTHNLFSTTKNNHCKDISSKIEGNSISSKNKTHKLSSILKDNHNRDIYSKGEGNSTSNTIKTDKLFSTTKNNHDTDIYLKRDCHSTFNATKTHKLSSITNNNNHDGDISSKREGNSISSRKIETRKTSSTTMNNCDINSKIQSNPNTIETRKLSFTTENNDDTDSYLKRESNTISSKFKTRKLPSTAKNNHLKRESHSISNIIEAYNLFSTSKNNNSQGDNYSRGEGNCTSNKVETRKLSSTSKNNHDTDIYSYTNQSTNQKDSPLWNKNTPSCTIKDNHTTDIDIHYYNEQSKNLKENHHLDNITKIHKLSLSHKKNDDIDVTSSQQINRRNSKHKSLKSKAESTSSNRRNNNNWSRCRQKSDPGCEPNRYRIEQKSTTSQRRHTTKSNSKHSSSSKSTKNKIKNMLKPDVTIDKKQLIRNLSLQSDILRYSEVMSDKITDAYHDEHSIIEIYKGQWCEDKRNGYGICQRSDGLSYIGNWCNNQLSGYGELTLKDGTTQRGFWRDNRLIFSIDNISLSRFRPVKNKFNAALFRARTAACSADKRAIIAKIRAVLARDHGMIANKHSKQACIAATKARYVVSQLQSSKRKGSSIETTV